MVPCYKSPAVLGLCCTRRFTIWSCGLSGPFISRKRGYGFSVVDICRAAFPRFVYQEW